MIMNSNCSYLVHIKTWNKQNHSFEETQRSLHQQKSQFLSCLESKKESRKLETRKGETDTEDA